MISLSPVQSFLACCLVLVVGRGMTTRIGILGRYSIPDPIVGGLLFAVLAYLLSTWGGLAVSLETSIKPTLLLLFFGCIGLTANLKLLAKGGPRLIAFLLALIPFLVLQNAVGLGMAWLLDMHPLMGLLGGTITLVGGHGTGAAYATRFADFNNIQDVMPLAMTAATLGLVLGGVVGGPVAEWIMRRHKVSGGLDQKAAEGQQTVDQDEAQTPPTPGTFILSLTAAFVCLVVGGFLAAMVEDAPVSLPNFLWCLATGVVIRNAGPLVGIRLDDRATDIIGTISLSLFLGMTMMTLDLSSVARLAGPLALMLVVQTLFCALYAAWVVFRMLKRDYEAAIMSAAFCGFALGATATAIANMQALTRRHGPAPEAFIVVPVTGAFLIDILNVIILSTLISLPFVGGI
ncbi:sodium/glutamate symporter [Achromobacter sp. NFACC18-2]|uniref:sodium/glutamate symporter n=1 Tax=Achromobacter sp. NFACC18-2 TaxID=1564112 RepID=UPI0008C44D3A|nr:sodium/glutamate symporter [Achromobacter sp. NFACC18-2]SEJ49755.1 glutamate:Na+ symporter, ESS family [Achromobacter sp. NFACC18-2]